jgi:hypothetical protein
MSERSGSAAEFIERAVRDGLAFSHFKQEDRFAVVAFLQNLLLSRRAELSHNSVFVGRRLTPERYDLIVAYLSNLLSLRRDELSRRGLFASRRLTVERESLIRSQIAELEDLLGSLTQSFSPDYESLIHLQIIELEDLIEKLSF